MSNLKLVPDEPTPLEKMLLDASRAELPSDDHKSKLRAALGIGLPLGAPLSSPPPASSSAPIAHAAAPASTSMAPAAVVVGKSGTVAKVALGVAALAMVGAFALSRQAAETPTPAKPAAQAVQAAAPVAAPAKEALPEVSPLPPVQQQPAVAPRGARADTSAAASDDLSEQIRLIEAARAGVASHDAKGALSALDSYGAKFPRGSFGQEALVLRIRAVDQSGDSARASAMAKSFLARFPNSPHTARLKPIAERGASR